MEIIGWTEHVLSMCDHIIIMSLPPEYATVLRTQKQATFLFRASVSDMTQGSQSALSKWWVDG